jgi:plastocyanin
MRGSAGLVCGFVAVVALSACGGDDESTTTDATSSSADAGTDATPVTFAPNGETVTVQALDNTFRVQDLTVEAGTEVLWDNVGRNDHNVIPVGDLEAVEWGVQTADFAPGDTYSRVFTTPGSYPYYCTIHGTEEVGMIGTITVTAP